MAGPQEQDVLPAPARVPGKDRADLVRLELVTGDPAEPLVLEVRLVPGASIRVRQELARVQVRGLVQALERLPLRGLA